MFIRTLLGSEIFRPDPDPTRSHNNTLDKSNNNKLLSSVYLILLNFSSSSSIISIIMPVMSLATTWRTRKHDALKCRLCIVDYFLGPYLVYEVHMGAEPGLCVLGLGDSLLELPVGGGPVVQHILHAIIIT